MRILRCMMNDTSVAHAARPLRRLRIADWAVPMGLIALTLVPDVAGAVRLTELAQGSPGSDGARFIANPLPIVLHIVAASGFCLVGAFQFSAGVRGRYRSFHHVAGRVLAPLGLIAAASGLWMTWIYPPANLDGPMLFAIRQVVGVAMIAFIVLALFALRARDFGKHGAWMKRGYALGMGAGTQVFTHLPLVLVGALKSELVRALAMAAGWVINLIVAEWLIRRGANGVRGSAQRVGAKIARIT